MGYEVIFHYKEQIERGVYEDEEKIKKLKVGSPYDEVSLEVLAGKVFAQLARRNILIEDVEIYEFQKKKLSYKETADGILIKNKKFCFDDGIATGTIEEYEDASVIEQFTKLITSNPQLVGILQGKEGQSSLGDASQPTLIPPRPSSPSINSLPHEKNVDKQSSTRNEIYDPPSWLAREATQRGLKFTKGKQYPILKERISDNPQAGMIYTTIDDESNQISIASIHFITVPIKLEGRFVEGDHEPISQENASNLSWSSVVDDSIPNLR